MKGSGDLFDEGAQTEFAEILLPVPIPRFFTYRIPKVLVGKTMAGQRVIVPFGQKKILTGVVVTVHGQPPKDYEAKYILELLDETEVIYPQQFKLYQWIADYYLCTLGEVLAAALPSGLKLSSESMVQLHPAFNEVETNFDFSERERMVINHLKNDTMTYSQVAKLLGAKSIYSILKSLASKSAILLFEQVREKFRPKTEKHIRLQPDYVEKKRLENFFDSLSAKPKQEAVMLKYLQLIPIFSHPELNQKGISKSKLVDEAISESSLNTLIKNKVLEEFEVIIPRFGFDDPVQATPLLLSEKQEKARNEILSAFETQRTALLHGVTGSGKTEIYIDLIKRALEGGNQVLYLLPEIAITTQVVQRLKKVFGSVMGVYHSKFSDNERVEVWNGVVAGKFRFVVGVRSSIFLPFDNLGLIIVDEEHDPSYKQHEPAPRYHARDVALLMGQIHHAKVLLGSATPSIESFYQTLTGKYQLVRLSDRFGEAQLPEIIFANTSTERKNKTMKGDFSRLLVTEMGDAVSKKEQVILFQNRRGYSPMIQCEDCGWVPKCINCSVSLTYHQYRHAMVCHYCGYKEGLPAQCPTCTSNRIQTLGYGTEKLEEELKLLFAEANVTRMDLDTTRSKSGYENIIEGFENGRTDILVGTQMVTKGLDFDRVSLVGVFDADRMMHFPDFRSYERAFQLITQVSGRAGRRNKRGKVIIQTSNPEHPLFQQLVKNDVQGFLEQQLVDRQEHFYPPYSRLIEITLKHTEKKVVRTLADEFVALIKPVLKKVLVLGPAEPIISKIRNEFLLSIAIKIARNQGNLGETKTVLSQIAGQLKERKEYRNVKIVFDVDPA
ncbi:MAG: primosomal protein N' [Cytophagales bacterium]